MADYAPVALFVYKRLDLSQQAVESLRSNNLARHTRLYIFSDAARSDADAAQVDAVRSYIASIDGFADVTVILSGKNYGCAHSVVAGVSQLFGQYDKIIVMEDDLVVTPNFLDYMNAALNFYENKEVFAISGFSIALRFAPEDTSDVYFLPRTSSWGWATWKNRWEPIDWAISDYTTFRHDKIARKRFNRGGSDLSRMLDLQMSGRIDSWAIRWCYALYKSGLPVVYPKLSKLKNIGFGGAATHTVNNPNFDVRLDDTYTTTFNFDDHVTIDPYLLRQFIYYSSIPYKIKNRLKNYGRKLQRLLRPVMAKQ